MHKSTLTLSITFLLAALAGGLLLVGDLWLKNAATAPVISVLSPPTIDGKIDQDEYAHSVFDEATGMHLYWTIVGDKVFLGLTSPGHGWLAVGLDPDGPMMRGADIFMGYVADGEAVLEDHFGDSPVTHKRDVDIGGSGDLVVFIGSEDDSGTIFELERYLITGDDYDKPLREGALFVQLAYADQDDWNTYHEARNTITVDFFAAEEERP